jgi:hypothetical protein
VIVALVATALLGAADPTLTADVKQIVLGETESVPVTIVASDGDDEQALWPLRVAVNVGSLGPLEPRGGGVFSTVYVPPATRFPQMAVIALWRERGPDAPIHFFNVPLHGSTTLKVQTGAGSSVVAVVGEQRFGPMTADARGRATIPILVPPGVRSAQVEVTNKAGLLTTSGQEIDVPPYSRITVAAVPTALIADGTQWARVEVMYQLGGAGVSPENIVITPSVGTVRLRSAAGGRYTYVYSPPTSTTERRALLEVRVKGDAAARATLELALGLPEPTRVVVRPPAAVLSADGRSTATVGVLVLDASGRGLPGQTLSVTANGVPLPAAVHRAWGLYETVLTSPATYPSGGLVQLAATLAGPTPLSAAVNFRLAPAATPGQVRLETEPPLPIAAPGTEVQVSFHVRDAAGSPLDGAELVATCTSGALGPLRADGNGRYVARYVPAPERSDEPVRVRVVDASGGFATELTLPLRPTLPALLAGARGGIVRSGALTTARGGAEVWLPFTIDTHVLAASVRVEATSTERRLGEGADAGLVLVPISAALAYELLFVADLSLFAGIEGSLALAYFTGPDGSSEAALGAGGGVFLSPAYRVGPGSAFADVGFGMVPVAGRDFELDAGGLRAYLGYRLEMF